MVSEKTVLKFQVMATLALFIGGGILLELNHPIGWAFIGIGLIAGLETLAEEIRLEILSMKKK